MRRIVLITTSGTGSRLGKYTKFTNKSLVNVGDKYAICRILESHPEETQFVITLGYYGNLVRDFLELAYPTKSFQFVPVDRFEGEGSSLVYSMLQAKEYLQNPFYFHCCDAIVDDKIEEVRENTLFVAEGKDVQSYSSVTTVNNEVLQMNAKGAHDYTYLYTGISYIHDVEHFWKWMDTIYSEDKLNTSLSDIHAIQKMLQTGCKFSVNVLSSWYDTGNQKSYADACKHYACAYDILEKETESLCFLGDSVIKFINNTQTNEKRYLRGKSLGNLCPEILGKRDQFLKMKFIRGTLVSESKQYDEVVSLCKWAKQHLWIEPSSNPDYKNVCLRFYKTKTLERIAQLPFLPEERLTVNGLFVGRIYDLLAQVDFSMLCTDTFTKFHGDFILDNIIKTENGYCLLDWRHEFDKELFYGDMYYDLAKLRHNIIFNHKNIMQGLYTIDTSGRSATVELKCNYSLLHQLDAFESFCREQGYSMKKIKTLTAIIWLNMAPLYEGKLREFLFYFGKYNLALSIFHTDL